MEALGGALKSNIVLVGFMCAGKTTVGRAIAGAAGMGFMDTDEAVERNSGATVAEIFESRGEERFREMERRAVAEASGSAGTVIALGGGAVMDASNVEAVRADGVVYYLRVSVADLEERSAGTEGRPLLRGRSLAEVADLMERREEFYLRAADVVVETSGREPEEIATEIIRDFAERAGGTGG